MRQVLAGALLLGLTPSQGQAQEAFAGTSSLPPAWRQGPADQTTEDSGDILDDGTQRGARHQKGQRSSRPWYVPRFALGVGTNVPELLPIEGYVFFGRYFGLRLFYAPPIPINVRVEMPSDVIATTKGVVAVANPAFTIHGKLTYGQQYGADAMVFPFGGSFFFGAGAAYRRIRLVADAKSPVLVCSIDQAKKDPPCSDPTAAIESRTELAVSADALTEAVLWRGAIGGFWHVGSYGYFLLNAGAAKPTAIHRNVNVKTGLSTPNDPDPEITGALAEVKKQREADLHDKAIQAMQPVDQQIVPILGIGAGIRF